MGAAEIGNRSFLIRAAQSVARRSILDLDEANRLGRQIAAYALENWERVTSRYGTDGADDLEIVERLTRDALAQRAETCAHTLTNLSHNGFQPLEMSRKFSIFS